MLKDIRHNNSQLHNKVFSQQPGFFHLFIDFSKKKLVIFSNFSQNPAESRAQKQVGANFLPSVVNEAYHNVLEQVVTAMCYKSGFDDIEEGALETLMLLFHSCSFFFTKNGFKVKFPDIKRIGEQSRLGCEVAGRTIVSPGDVWFALINMGISVKELSDFQQDQIVSSLTVHPRKFLPTCKI